MADMSMQDFKGSAFGRDGVKTLRDVAKVCVYERERTKRILILTVAVLFIAAAGIMVFAPEGKETIAYILGAILVILALGAIGVSGFLLKLPAVQLDTRPETANLERETKAVDHPDKAHGGYVQPRVEDVRKLHGPLPGKTPRDRSTYWNG